MIVEHTVAGPQGLPQPEEEQIDEWQRGWDEVKEVKSLSGR